MADEPQSLFSEMENQKEPNLANDLNNQPEDNRVISTVPKNSTETENITAKSIANALDKGLKKNMLKLPYQDGEEIPEIKIKDEDFFVSGEEIKLYKKYEKDDKYNKCKLCEDNDNRFFCHNCNANFCQNCFNIKCKKKNHLYFDLEEKKAEANNYKKEIFEAIFSKYNIDPKKNEKDENLKSNKADGFTEENFEDVNYDSRNMFSTNDMKLIEAILLNDYNNYFHFKNIKACYDYLNNFYKDIYDSECLKIEYGIDDNNKDKETEYKIFGRNFVKNNKNIISLIINGKRSELVEIAKIKENYLQVIVIQTSKEKYLENLSCMFCGCGCKSITFKKMKNRYMIDLRHVTDISYMFKDCSNLKEIDLNFFEVMNKITKIEYLFSGCKNIVKYQI